MCECEILLTCIVSLQGFVDSVTLETLLGVLSCQRMCWMMGIRMRGLL